MPTQEKQLLTLLESKSLKRAGKEQINSIIQDVRALVKDLLDASQYNRAADLLDAFLYSWVCDVNEGYDAYNELVDHYNHQIAQRNRRVSTGQPAVA